MKTREFVDDRELALQLGVTAPVVRGAAAAGQLPGRRVGRRWIFQRSALEAWFRAAGPRL